MPKSPDALYISPQQLSTAVDVSESTLKRWIDRGLIRASRTAGGHRRLLLSDVISFLRRSGVPIINPQVLGLPSLDQRRSDFVIGGDDVGRLVDALAEGDPQVVKACIMQPFLAGLGMAAVFDTLIAPAMHEVGLRWEHGDVTIYAEHRATQLLHGTLIGLRDLIATPAPDALVAVGGAPEGDPYAAGSLGCELCLRDIGWRTVNLGPQLPADSLAGAIREYRPALAWYSFTSSSMQHAEERFKDLFAAAEGCGCRLIVGGQALPKLLTPRKSILLEGKCMQDLVAYAQKLADELGSVSAETEPAGQAGRAKHSA